MKNLRNTTAIYSAILIALFAFAHEISITPESVKTILDKVSSSYLVSTASLNVATDYVGIWQFVAIKQMPN
jgi:hypothetical protein